MAPLAEVSTNTRPSRAASPPARKPTVSDENATVNVAAEDKVHKKDSIEKPVSVQSTAIVEDTTKATSGRLSTMPAFVTGSVHKAAAKLSTAKALFAKSAQRASVAGSTVRALSLECSQQALVKFSAAKTVIIQRIQGASFKDAMTRTFLAAQSFQHRAVIATLLLLITSAALVMTTPVVEYASRSFSTLRLVCQEYAAFGASFTAAVFVGIGCKVIYQRKARMVQASKQAEKTKAA